jgi:hypothetical protein
MGVGSVHVETLSDNEGKEKSQETRPDPLARFLDDDRNSQYVRLKLHEKTVGRRSSVDPNFFHFAP